MALATFPIRLRKLRRRSGISQISLSKKLDMGDGMIGNYEHGACEPTLSKLEKIADYFGVSLDYLSGRSEVPNDRQAEKNAVEIRLMRRSVVTMGRNLGLVREKEGKAK